jgi:G3E family GTPase
MLAPAKTNPLDVLVLAGPVGAGKTTLLDRLVADALAQGRRPGVLMNEFAEVDADGTHLHARHGEALELLSVLGGCVCCDLSSDLETALGTLLGRVQGAPVFVETTGLADVPQVTHNLQRLLHNHPNARLAGVVAVLDAVRAHGHPASADAAALAGADVVLLNHADRLAAGPMATLEKRVRRAAPSAHVHITRHADIPLQALLDAGHTAIARSDEAPVSSTAGMKSQSFRLVHPVDLGRLETLCHRYARSLARLKGVVRTPGTRALTEVHWLPGQFQARAWMGAPVETHMVAIGQRVPWERFFDAVEKVMDMPRRRRRA